MVLSLKGQRFLNLASDPKLAQKQRKEYFQLENKSARTKNNKLVELQEKLFSQFFWRTINLSITFQRCMLSWKKEKINITLYGET